MPKTTKKADSNQIISRRSFVKVGGAVIAGTTLNLSPIRNMLGQEIVLKATRHQEIREQKVTKQLLFIIFLDASL